MVPYSVFGQPLGLLFTEHLPMLLVFFWYFPFLQLSELLGVYRDPSNEVFRFRFDTGYVFHSWYEHCFLCIWGSQDDGQLCVVNPSSFPIDVGLYCSEPWVPQDGLVFAQVR
jgi:hypothetical protein